MQCREATELFPWLINDTLSDDQREAVEAHLEECPDCRTRLGEAGTAAKLYSQHIPSTLLMDYAEGRPLSEDEAALITRHLEICHDCADQLNMARESWASLRDQQSQLPEPPRAPRSIEPAPSFVRRFGALAAGLLLMVSLAGWMSISWWSSKATLSTPRLNVLTADVLPESLTQRSGGTDAHLEFESGQDVTLILNSVSRQTYPDYDVKIQDSGQRVIWSGSGLRRNPSGDYTISLPEGFLAPGNYKLLVSPSSNPDSVEIYLLKVS